MLPFITILGRQFPTYAVLGLVAVFGAALVGGCRAGRYGFTRRDAFDIAAFAAIGLAVGGTLLYGIIQTPNIWRDRALILSNFPELAPHYFGGMIFYGGLFGAFGAVYFYSRLIKVSFADVAALAVPVFPLAHAIMRVGCFSAGCCYGIEHPPHLGVAFSASIAAPNNVYLLPVQLYESAVNIIIFGVMWVFTSKDRNWTVIVCSYALMYSFARFWLEFIRGDAARGAVAFFSTSQLISVVVFTLCVCALAYKYGRTSKQPQAHIHKEGMKIE